MLREPVHALIVVDAQVGLLRLDPVPDAERLVATLGRLLTRARTVGVPVVLLQNRGEAGSIDEPGSSGWHLDERLGVAEPDIVVAKGEDDGFAGTQLAELLDEHQVGHLAIAGLLSESCVAATARAAMAHGYAVMLATDAHGTYDLDDIPARSVARVAEHSLGDEVRLARAEDILFERPAGRRR